MLCLQDVAMLELLAEARAPDRGVFFLRFDVSFASEISACFFALSLQGCVHVGGDDGTSGSLTIEGGSIGVEQLK